MTKKATTITAGKAVTFQFNDEAEDLICRVDELDQEMLIRLAVHGAKQKVSDSYAGSISVKEARDKAESTWKMLLSGEWSQGRDSTGGDLLIAVMEATGQGEDECVRLLGGMSAEKKKEIRKQPAIAKVLLRIKAEKLAKKAAGFGEEKLDLADLVG